MSLLGTERDKFGGETRGSPAWSYELPTTITSVFIGTLVPNARLGPKQREIHNPDSEVHDGIQSLRAQRTTPSPHDPARMKEITTEKEDISLAHRLQE